MKRLIKFFRSLHFCISYLPLKQAIKLPVLVETPIDVIKCRKGQIILNDYAFGSVRLSADSSSYIPNCTSKLYIREGGVIIFEGKAKIGAGFSIAVSEHGNITFGDNFYSNKNVYFKCTQNTQLKFGKDCKVGWACEFTTSDGHELYKNNIISNFDSSILIHDHCWITSHCLIGKGVEIASNCVISKGAIVTKSIYDRYCVVGGVPAKVISTDVNWSKEASKIRNDIN